MISADKFEKQYMCVPDGKTITTVSSRVFGSATVAILHNPGVHVFDIVMVQDEQIHKHSQHHVLQISRKRFSPTDDAPNERDPN